MHSSTHRRGCRPAIGVWHNTTGRPIVSSLFPRGYRVCAGCLCNDPLGCWKRNIEKYGHAITVDAVVDRTWNHHVIGVGVGHDDARWCESRFTEGSMAAYYENGESVLGRQIAALR